MTVEELNIEAVPKSNTQTLYPSLGTVTYSAAKISGNGESESTADKDAEDEVVFLTELPLPGLPGKLYVNLLTYDIFYFFVDESSETGEGVYKKIANIRLWSGNHSERPAEGIEGWLYLELDEKLLFMWDADSYAYLNLSGVVEIYAELPLTVDYNDRKDMAMIAINKATVLAVGVVKPDGTTITIDSDGKISGTKILAGTAISINPAAGTGNVTITNVGVTKAIAGTAISVSPAGGTGEVTINNTGVTRTTAGTGISLNANTGNVTIANSGVTSATAGSGISVNSTTGAVTITNTGVTRINAGSNISISANTGQVTISASTSGVTSIYSGSGISVSGTTGSVTITNSGVRSVYAGTGISVSSSTGAPTITNTRPYNSYVMRGNKLAAEAIHPCAGNLSFKDVAAGAFKTYIFDDQLTVDNTFGWTVNIFLPNPELRITAGTYIDGGKIGIYLRNESDALVENITVGYSFLSSIFVKKTGEDGAKSG